MKEVHAMSCIVYLTDRNGNKYAYESISYWDKEKGQPRSKRKYIGKVDPETGNIIPKKTRASAKESKQEVRLPEDTGQAVQTLYEEIRSRDNQISLLRNENRQLEKRCHKLEELLRQIGTIVGEASDV